MVHADERLTADGGSHSFSCFKCNNQGGLLLQNKSTNQNQEIEDQRDLPRHPWQWLLWYLLTHSNVIALSKAHWLIVSPWKMWDILSDFLSSCLPSANPVRSVNDWEQGATWERLTLSGCGLSWRQHVEEGINENHHYRGCTAVTKQQFMESKSKNEKSLHLFLWKRSFCSCVRKIKSLKNVISVGWSKWSQTGLPKVQLVFHPSSCHL